MSHLWGRTAESLAHRKASIHRHSLAFACWCTALHWIFLNSFCEWVCVYVGYVCVGCVCVQAKGQYHQNNVFLFICLGRSVLVWVYECTGGLRGLSLELELQAVNCLIWVLGTPTYFGRAGRTLNFWTLCPLSCFFSMGARGPNLDHHICAKEHFLLCHHHSLQGL